MSVARAGPASNRRAHMFAARMLARSGAVLAALAGFSGCAALVTQLQGVTAEQVVTEKFQFGAPPRVIVKTFNGPIEVNVGETGSVQVQVVLRAKGADPAEAEANLKKLTLRMEQPEAGVLEVEA